MSLNPHPHAVFYENTPLPAGTGVAVLYNNNNMIFYNCLFKEEGVREPLEGTPETHVHEININKKACLKGHMFSHVLK